MNVKRFALALLAMFIALGGTGYVIFEIVFTTQFESLYALMRPQADLDQQFALILLARALETVMLGYIFLKGYENKGVMEGLRYGLLMGLFLATIDIVWYASLPIEGATGAALILSDIAMMMVGGTVMAAVYRPLETPE